MREAIEAAEAIPLYLPPYSPDFNPIENGISKLKAHIRKAAARTVEALQAAVAGALKTFQPHECTAFFAVACALYAVLGLALPRAASAAGSP